MNKLSFGVLSAVLALAAGCGSSGSSTDSGPPNLTTDQFDGTWRYTAGQITLSGCGGIEPAPIALVGQSVDLSRGSMSDLVRVQLGCGLKMTIKGNVATANAGQTCMLSVPSMGLTINATLDVTEWKITLDGNTGTTSGTGHVNATIPIGSAMTSIMCTLREMGTVTKGGTGPDGGASSDAAPSPRG